MPEKPEGGRKGSTKASVTGVFTNRLRDLHKRAKQMQNAQQGKHQRQWMIPEDMQAEILDVPQLHFNSWDRTEINDQYAQVTKDPAAAGTNGDIISLKLQMDYNACEERAFRARHATLCRVMCLAHGRRFGQGHGEMWFPGKGIEAEVAAFIAAGGASS